MIFVRSQAVVLLPFCALLQLAEAANYPFCTIEPNIAKVSIPNSDLDKLASVANSEKTIYSQIQFVDIAGLVRCVARCTLCRSVLHLLLMIDFL